ncbi:MAG TPA: GDP-fucose synthetase, partial [Gammaproteobacteria bacterium]|nr:GDP-fucose synthetase [Gammaproteobacteria bacterium]
LMPTNLYGPGDNYDLNESHVMASFIRKFHHASKNKLSNVICWGTGNPLREFLHVDDLAAACAHILELPREKLDAVTEPMCSHLNVGTGKDVTIRDLAEMLVGVIGFDGEIIFDSEKPDGAPRKLLDVKKINLLGWEASIGLEEGLASTYNWFLENQTKLRI